MKRSILLGLILVPLAACSHVGSGALPPAAGAFPAPAARDAGPTGNVSISLTIPASTAALRARYVSPSTKSMLVDVYNDTHATLLVKQTVELSKTSHGCSIVAKGFQCTTVFAVPAGTQKFDVTLFDKPNAAGHALSALKDFPHAVVAGKTATLSLVLGGIAASIDVIPPASAAVSGALPAGFTIVGNSPQKFTIVAKDADGNAIVGPGAPGAAITGQIHDATIAKPSTTTPNVWTLTSTYHSTNPTTAATSSATAVATPVPDSGGSAVKVTIPLHLLQPWVYVMNFSATGAGAITAYDDAGNAKTLTGAWDGLSSAGWAVYAPATGWLYVSKSNIPGGILVYDLMGNTKTVSGYFANVYFPGQPALDPIDNEIFVPNNEGPNYVTAYDLQGNQQTLPTYAFNEMLNGAIAMTYDSANNWLYGISFSNKTMTAFDTSGTALTVGGFPNLDEPEGIAYDQNNSELYVSNEAPSLPQNAVTVYDSKGKQLTAAGGFPGITGAGGLACDPYDGKIFVANYTSPSGSIAAFDERGNALTLPSNAFAGVNGPYGIVVVP